MTKYRRASFRTPEDRFLAEVFARGSNDNAKVPERIAAILVVAAAITFILWLYWKGAFA